MVIKYGDYNQEMKEGQVLLAPRVSFQEIMSAIEVI
jgi:hypothetical protein